MTWQNPWAWLGLVMLGVPVLIHLLTRRSARVQRFPSLRFLETSQLLPRRHARLSDLPLLVLRAAILAAAVAALAQPRLSTAGRERDAARTRARAIVVDTSASMRRSTPSGEPALVAARREAVRAGGEVNTFVILESAAPAPALAGAVAWLATQAGLHEVVIVSDFQTGTIEQLDLASLPAGAGLQFRRVEVIAANAPIEQVTHDGSVETVARSLPSATHTSVEWVTRPAGRPRQTHAVLSGAGERAGSDAAMQAALALGLPAADSTKPVVIVHPQYEQRERLLREAKSIDRTWMGAVVVRLRRDSLLQAAAADALPDHEPNRAVRPAAQTPSPPRTADDERLVAVARTEDGQAVALAASGLIDGRPSLLLFSMADAGSLASAALFAAAANAVSSEPPVSELEPSNLPNDALRQWQRPARPSAVTENGADGATSDGRWFWLFALVLLVAERTTTPLLRYGRSRHVGTPLEHR